MISILNIIGKKIEIILLYNKYIYYIKKSIYYIIIYQMTDFITISRTKNNISDKMNRDLRKLYNDTYINIINKKPKNKTQHYLLFWNDIEFMPAYNKDSYNIRKEISNVLNTDFKNILLFVNPDKLQVGFKDFSESNVKKILDILSNKYIAYRTIQTIQSSRNEPSSSSRNETSVRNETSSSSRINKSSNTSNIKNNELELKNQIKIKKLEFKKIYKINITDNIFESLINYNSLNKYNGNNSCRIQIKYIDDFIINRKDIITAINNELLININIIIKKDESKIDIIFNNLNNETIGKILVNIEEWDNSFSYLYPSKTLCFNDIINKKKSVSKKKTITVKSNTIKNDPDTLETQLNQSTYKELNYITMLLINNDDEDNDMIDNHIVFSKGPGIIGTRRTKNEAYNRGSASRHSVANETKKNNTYENYLDTEILKSSIDNTNSNRNSIGIVNNMLGHCRVKVLKYDINGYNTNVIEVTASICGSLRKKSNNINIIKPGDFVFLTSMLDDKYYIELKITEDTIKHSIDLGILNKMNISNLTKTFKYSKYQSKIEDSDDDYIVFEDSEFDDFIDDI